MTILCQKLDYAELLAQRHSWLSLSLALLAYALCAGWSSGEFACIVIQHTILIYQENYLQRRKAR